MKNHKDFSLCEKKFKILKHIYEDVIKTLDKMILERDSAFIPSIDREKLFDNMPKKRREELFAILMAKQGIEEFLDLVYEKTKKEI